VLPSNVQNYPPLCMCWKLLFIGKNIVRSPNLVPQLLFFFCKFDFSHFLNFSYQHRLEKEKSLILKITHEKSNAFKRPLKI